MVRSLLRTSAMTTRLLYRFALVAFALVALVAACGSSGRTSPDEGGSDGGQCASSDGVTVCPGCPDEATVSAGKVCELPGKTCMYLRAYCPEHPLGSFYYYENAVYRCEGGWWKSKGQDCYDCCRVPLGGSVWPSDGGASVDTGAIDAGG